MTKEPLGSRPDGPRLPPLPRHRLADEDDLWLAGLRNRFLQAIRVVNPDVPRSLQADVLPVFAQTAFEPRDPMSWWWIVRAGRIDSMGYVLQEHLLPLKEALQAWCSKWHLIDDWLKDAVLQTLALWRRDTNALERLEWYILGGDEPAYETPRLAISGPLTVRFIPEGTTRAPHRDDLDRDLLWLAYRVIFDASPSQIAEHFNVSLNEQSIREVIDRAARDIGLTLPKRPRGRPRKAR